tara:strand:+ start:1367 stop:3586 length:2220 start_codon:yes stop_codon:yes gene_type:complete
MIDLKKEPIDNFVDLLAVKNPSLPSFTADDIAIRRLSLNEPSKWDAPYAIGTMIIDGYGTKQYLVPDRNWPKNYCGFLLHRKINFKGGDVTFLTRSDNKFTVWVDGVEIYSGADYTTTLTHVENIAAGEKEVYIYSHNSTGGAGLAAVINDAGTHYDANTSDWTCLEIGSDDPKHWVGHNGESTVEVDLLIQPSEATGDYVEFQYERITMQNLFGGMDYNTNVEGVQVPYHIDDIDMILGSVANFKSIYETWYRFSHNSTRNYPASPTEVDKWRYIEEYDCVECTYNTSTYIGFISDDMYDDYEFNTVITANNGDDDSITCILAAFKQGDIDEFEHTLDLVMTRGGLNGSYIRLNSNYAHVGNKYVRVIDSDTTPPNSGNPWTPWYGHVIAKREGSILTIWTRQERLPTPEAGQSRDDMIKVLVTDLARWTEVDFVANNYFKTVIDLSVEETKFNRSVRFGYGAQSQGLARYWNIRRPGDNPSVTPKLKNYMVDRYGVNVGSDGITVENMGANEFKLSLDNVLYHGELQLTPNNRRYILGAQSLLDTGLKFSHNTSGNFPASAEDLTKWSVEDGKIRFAGGGTFSGVVTPYAATEYEFHTEVASTGGQHYPVAAVIGYVKDADGEHTLSVLCDVPEGVGGGEWSIVHNTLQSDTSKIADNGTSDVAYTWADISTRNIYVKRVGDTIEVIGNNKHDEPGKDWSITIDLASDARLAKFRGECHFGYGCYVQAPSTFKDKIV